MTNETIKRDEERAKFEKWWEEWFGEAPMSGWEALWCGEGYAAEEIDNMWDSWLGRALLETSS